MVTEQLDWFVDLGRVVAAGKEPPETIAQRLGVVEEDTGGTIYVRPTDERYQSALVSYDRRNRMVSSATVIIATGHAFPAVTEFKARFGEFTSGPKSHFRQPLGLTFEIDLGGPRVCKLIAFVPNDHQPTDQWRVERVTVMGDARL